MAGDLGLNEFAVILDKPLEDFGIATEAVIPPVPFLHKYGDRVLISATPLPETVDGVAGIQSFGTGVAVPESTLAGLSETERLGLEALALRQSAEYVDTKLNRVRDGVNWNMEGCNQPGPEEFTRAGSFGVDANAPGPTSSFLEGSVAVGIVIVEGPTADLKFSAAERTKVVAEVQNGLGWLATLNPSAGINFTYDVRVVSLAVAANPGAANLEGLWRDPAMAALGFAANFGGVTDYVNSNRTRFRTRWTYCGFFVKYPLNHFAYASIGGPRLVMDYHNDGWGPDNIDRVFTHESGHIFGCPDEYAASNCNCGGTWGRFGDPNINCENCAPGGGVACLMKGNSWTMCSATPRHFGWSIARTAPDVAAWAPGRLDIFGLGTDRAMYHKAWDGAWRPSPLNWERLGGSFAGPSSVVSWAANRLDLFALSTENRSVRHKAWDGSAWRPSPADWEDLGGVFTSDPAAVSWGPNRLDIFGLGTDRAMYHKAWNGAWHPSPTDWERLGGVFTSEPAVASWGHDRLDVFGLGTDRAMYHKAWDGSAWRPGPLDWERLGGIFISPPRVVAWGPNRLDIFGLGTDGAMYHKAWNGAWHPSPTDWERLGGVFTSAPAVVSWASGRLDIFGLGTDGAMYHKAWNGAWRPSPTDWERLGGVFTSAPAVTAWAANRLDIFGLGTDGAMYHKAWDGSAWRPSPADWERLGGVFL